MKIFLIDDETILSASVKKKLLNAGFMVEIFESYDNLVRNWWDSHCDLYIVDIWLPGEDGFTIINYIRNTLLLDTPIIVLSWYQSVDYKVQSLHMWADDYVTKPFSSEELVARIQTILRRKWAPTQNSQLKHKNITLDLQSKDVFKNWEALSLTKKERELLEYFMFNTWKLITRNDVIASVWEDAKDLDKLENTLGVTLFNLRKKLGDDFNLQTKMKEWYILK